MDSSTTPILINMRVICNYPKAETRIKKLSNDLAWLLPADATLFACIYPPDDQVVVDSWAGGIGGGGEVLVTNLLVTVLGTGGIVAVINGIFLVVSKLMERDKGCEVTIEANGRKLTIKGEKIPSARELMSAVFPGLDIDQIPPAKTRLKLREEYLRERDPAATVALLESDDEDTEDDSEHDDKVADY